MGPNTIAQAPTRQLELGMNHAQASPVTTKLQHLKVEGGLSLAYRDSGSGPPLLLIHGITEDHHAWDELIPELSRDSRVIRIDLPGHGESSPLVEYSAPGLVTPLAELVQTLKLDRPHVIGHSLGGLMATLLGAVVPVRSIINVDQSLRLASFIELVHGIAPRLSGPGFVDALHEEMELLGGPRLPERVRRELRAYRVEARRPVVLGLWLPLVDQTEEAVVATLTPLLQQVRAPYLSLHGSDPGPGYEAWLRGLVQSARVETWDGLGHWLHRVEPERFVRRVREFHAATA
jgi:pimeloyl-ACP methyl ester carboxylesterase